MNWFDKIFSWNNDKVEEETTEIASQPTQKANVSAVFSGLENIVFGRYNDNNKSHAQELDWYLAEDRFKEKNYSNFITAFFQYLQDKQMQNVLIKQEGTKFTFTIFQGSVKVTGGCDGNTIIARSPIAVMESANPAVMRRLLEMNFSLQYCHSAMDENNCLYLSFESELNNTSPSKLYYGLKELALKSDAEDDNLLRDFPNLKPIVQDPIKYLPSQEVEVKYKYFTKWIEETLEIVANLNPDSFSNAINYLLLDIIYRINFLIVPEGKIRIQIQQIILDYWANNENSLAAKNNALKESIRKLLEISKEDFAANMYSCKYSFSISKAPKAEKVREHIIRANNEAIWFLENNFALIALLMNECGMLYNEYVYSMPQIQTEFIMIYMAVLHAEFFEELGMKVRFIDPTSGQLNQVKITAAIDEVIAKYQEKYADISWDHKSVVYDNLYEFAIHFSEQVANLKLDLKLR